MKSLIIFLAAIIFSITNAYSKEEAYCKNLKKFSLKAGICKTGASLGAFKDKVKKKRELKKEAKKKSGKKSIFEKFREAKTLKEFETDLK